MLPAHHKLTSPVQFRRAIKGGKRAGSRTVVVHVYDNTTNEAEVASSGPRFGLIVSKAVGNAVVRHRTSRRLRHVCLSLVPDLPASVDIVIRALPAAGTADSDRLRGDIERAIGKVARGARVPRAGKNENELFQLPR